MVTRIEVETTLAHYLDEAAGDTCQALRNAIVDALLCLDEAEHRRARAEASVSRGFARLGPPRGSTANTRRSSWPAPEGHDAARRATILQATQK
jgi:hypothetical protein